MQISLTPSYTRVKDSTKNQFAVRGRVSNQRRHSSTLSLQHVTHREQRSEVLSRDSLEQTLQIKHLKKTLPRSKKHLMERGYRQNFVNNTLSKVKFEETEKHKPSSNKTKQRYESCPS